MPSWLTRRGALRNKNFAIDTLLDPSVNGAANVQECLQGLTGGTGMVVTPELFGGDPTGQDSSVDAINLCIDRMNTDGAILDPSNGTWLIDGDLDTITRPLIVGDSTGTFLVDYAVPDNRVILECIVPLGTVYTVAAVTTVERDLGGAFAGSTLVTRIQITLGGGQVMPTVGKVAKLTATNQILGADVGDLVGQLVYIVDVSGSFVYVPSYLVDTFSTSMQLVVLDESVPTILSGFNIKGVFADVVADDLLYDLILVANAVQPIVERVTMAECGGTGLALANTYLATTQSLRCRRFRNATGSESPAIPGYGVTDRGNLGSVHFDLQGTDCRHAYTTISYASTASRSLWGRAVRPLIIGGVGVACSAAAFDTHSDAWEAEFRSCRVLGGYFGESSAGGGFQLRGNRCRIVDTSVMDCPVGILIYKQYAGEVTEHEIIGYDYRGLGQGIKTIVDDLLTGENRRSTLRLGDMRIATTEENGIDIDITNLEIEGKVTVEHRGTIAAAHAIKADLTSRIRSIGRGILVHDFSRMTGTPNPRVISVLDDGFTAPGLNVQVIAGAVGWQSVVSENNNPAASMGAMRVFCAADTDPATASGGFSGNGAGNLLTAGALDLRLTIAGAGYQSPTGTGFNLRAWHHEKHFTINATGQEITIPASNILGPNFECHVRASGFSVLLNGPGASNVTLANGAIARIFTDGSAVRVHVAPAADFTTVS